LESRQQWFLVSRQLSLYCLLTLTFVGISSAMPHLFLPLHDACFC